MLLTFDEFKEIGGRAAEDSFNKLELQVEDLFQTMTGAYYVYHDIKQDPDATRVKFYKKAMVLQIDYMNDIGATTPYDIATKSIRSVSIDGTTVSSGKSAADSASHGLYNLARWYLYQTGLLFRGVPIC